MKKKQKKNNKKSNKVKRILIKTLTALTILLVIFVGVAYYGVFSANTTVNDEDKGVLYIHANTNFNTITEELKARGYLKSTATFRVVAKLKKYPSSIKQGCYFIRDGMSNNELINMLRIGKQQAINFTFNNLRSLDQLASLLSRHLAIDSARFMKLTTDKKLLADLGFTKENFSAMFIPNSYQLYWNITEEEFIQRMNREYKKFWNEQRVQKAKEAGLNPVGVVTIASIVEEETLKKSEYPIIAGVYINRLRKGMKLQACPSLKFALGDFTLKRVLNEHMEVESPYNTYKYKGLPPGPVRLPSVSIVDAVLDYQHHNYLYFAARSDFSGGHYFSKTLAEHNRHAHEYHRELNKRKIR
ncbi:aminodeoxychorismate lyase [Bacteroidia bacterium]|nr:aminodeoxychorismate lyase [Bacteroidia bacterium]